MPPNPAHSLDIPGLETVGDALTIAIDQAGPGQRALQGL